MIDLTGYLIVGAAAAGATAVMTPIVTVVARKRGWMAAPDERRNHPVPTPNIGGVAFLAGLLFALFVVVVIIILLIYNFHHSIYIFFIYKYNN